MNRNIERTVAGIALMSVIFVPVYVAHGADYPESFPVEVSNEVSDNANVSEITASSTETVSTKPESEKDIPRNVEIPEVEPLPELPPTTNSEESKPILEELTPSLSDVSIEEEEIKEIPVFIRSKIEPVTPPTPLSLEVRPALQARSPQPVRTSLLTPPPLPGEEKLVDVATTTELIDISTTSVPTLPETEEVVSDEVVEEMPVITPVASTTNDTASTSSHDLLPPEEEEVPVQDPEVVPVVIPKPVEDLISEILEPETDI